MSNRQFVKCKFRAADTRLYTYHWDGEPLAEGDLVKVEDAKFGGWKRVTVVEVDVPEPTQFATKPILGKVEPDDGLPDAPAAGPDPLSDPIAF